MFHSARSNGRALAILQPCARLNLANAIGKRTWNGTLQQRRHWSRQATAKSELYEDEYPAATKLKDTGLFAYRKRKPSKKEAAAGDGSRVNIVNKKLASTMPPPQVATHPAPPILGLSHRRQSSTDQQAPQMMSSRTSDPRSNDIRDAI